MEAITTFFGVDTIAFTIIGYPMSYIEFIGTVLYLLSVWLIAKRNILTWPIGIVSVILYFALFYQIRLYSDAVEQIYYLGMSVYGWWFWNKKSKENSPTGNVRFSSQKQVVIWIAVTIVLTILLGQFVSLLHLILPTMFPEPASYPFLDAFTTIMSFVAMFLMTQKRLESWFYWIIVDVLGIWLYFAKDVKFLSLLYVVLLCIAVNGLFEWIRMYKESKEARNFV